MVFHVVKNFISKEDVQTVQEYIKTVDFNTKDNHPPLHDNLYENFNAPFDIHTRGEMPAHILDVFSKYSKDFYKILKYQTGGEDYHPPMFSKHYIARCNTGFEIGPQWDESKPAKTMKSIIYWNNDFEGGKLIFPNLHATCPFNPGDLIYFVECETNAHKIEKITNGTLYMSEAWAGLKGQAWMYNVDYENTDWDNWEIKGF